MDVYVVVIHTDLGHGALASVGVNVKGVRVVIEKATKVFPITTDDHAVVTSQASKRHETNRGNFLRSERTLAQTQ